jgi:uncharacterized protein (DUF1330 family)
MRENQTVLVINAIINNANVAEVQAYLSSVRQVFRKYGGKPAARFKTAEQIAGTDAPEMIAIIEFPDSDTIKGMIEGKRLWPFLMQESGF